MNSRQVLDKISRSRSLSEQQRLAQDAIAHLEAGSLRELFKEISRSQSATVASKLAHMTIDALDRDAAASNYDSRSPVTADDLMEQMKANPLPTFDGWGNLDDALDSNGRSLMEKARSNYGKRQAKAKRRQDAINRALAADEAIGSGYSVAKPSAQVMSGAGYYF